MKAGQFDAVKIGVRRLLQAFPSKRQSEYVHPLVSEIIHLGLVGISVMSVVSARQIILSEFSATEIHTGVFDGVGRDQVG